MEKRIQDVAAKAQEAFWAVVAESFPEITSGDFPPDEQMAFDAACVSATTVWVTGNMKESAPVLSETDLTGLGYQIIEDPDQLMWWLWRRDNDASITSFASKLEAIMDANDDALGQFELSRCDSCSKVHSEQTLLAAKHLSMRVASGGVMPSGECPDCGALCYPLDM